MMMMMMRMKMRGDERRDLSASVADGRTEEERRMPVCERAYARSSIKC